MIPAIVNAIVVPPLLALLVSGAVIAVLIRTRAAVLALDHPNQRSLHATPTPRLGGMGIAAGVAVAWCYAGSSIDPRLLGALALLVGISVLDDVKSVKVVWRLVVHLASAALGVIAVLPTQPLWVILVAILATAWMINLYNFMDGSDGLAGGMAVFGFGTYAVAALAGGDFSFAAVNLAIAAAALGFLLFNFPPAKVFMGDGGAIPLGYLAAVLGVVGWLRGDWPLWFGAVVFSAFIVDASITLLKRLARGAQVWQAHKEHYYQRLVQNGWGHRKTALAEFGLMFVCGGVAIVGTRLEAAAQAALVAGVGLLYAVLIYALERNLPSLARLKS